MDTKDRTSIVVTGSADHKHIYSIEPFHFPSAEDAWLFAHSKYYSKLSTYYWVVSLDEPSEEDMTKTVILPTQASAYGLKDWK